MIFPFPTLEEDVDIWECEANGDSEYEIETAAGDLYAVTPRLADLLAHLEVNAVNPYTHPAFRDCSEEEMDELLTELMDCGLLRRRSRFEHYAGPLFTFSLTPLFIRRRPWCGWATIFLLFAGPLSLLASLYLVPRRIALLDPVSLSPTVEYAVVIAFLLLSLLLHELAHAVTAIATGGNAWEIGALALLILPVGMYVSYSPRIDCSRFSQFTVAVSGVCANAFSAFVCLLLCGHTAAAADFFLFCIAINNLLLVAVNLLPGSITDGGLILESLTGISGIHRQALQFLFSAKKRHRTLQQKNGLVTAGAYLLAIAGQLSVMLYLLYSLYLLFS